VDGKTKIKPILRTFEVTGSTDYVDFDTTKPVVLTDPDKSHVSHVVADTESWEQKMASVLEEMSEVVSYVKNQNLGFTIPYALEGDERSYLPDFIAKVKVSGSSELLNLIVEVSGEKRKDKMAKVETAKTLWVPAVNNYGAFGTWGFIEISDPWDAKNLIRSYLENLSLENTEGQ
jgi:type III restriction enzyme